MSGYRHCATEGSADRQRQFEQALLELMQLSDFRQITVQELCDRVGLSRKSFYRYFSNLESCLQALLDHTILDFTEMTVSPSEMEGTLEGFFAYWKEHQPLLDALSKSGQRELLYQRAMVCAAGEYGIRECFFQENSGYEQTVFFISGLFGVLLAWHGGGCRKSPAQMAAALTKRPTSGRGG